MTTSFSRRTFLVAGGAWAASGLIGERLLRGEVIPPGKAATMLIRGDKPFNGEPRMASLVQSYLTPPENFFVRSHGEIPPIDPQTFRLKIEGLVHKSLEISLAELKDKFKSYRVTATLTCAGNRRNEHSAIKKLSGVAWDAGAISTAEWTGAFLGDVLAAAGLKAEAKHVWFEGLEEVKEKDGSVGLFGASIPLAKLDKPVDSERTLVAYGMAGKDLPPQHGYPLRTIVPGYIGARSVKWLGKIIVSDRPSLNKYVANDYKIIPRDDSKAYAAAEPIYNYVTNAAICLPETGAKLKPGETKVAGYALAAPGSRITKVELSRDGGKTWTKATLGETTTGFNWTLWEARVNLPAGEQTLIVRATDSTGFTMPERVDWNAKGYLFNAWHSSRFMISDL